MTAQRSRLAELVPAHFQDPFGLAWRLIRSGRREARAAMAYAALGALTWPLDRLLASAERRRVAASGPPEHPVVIVVGPPRSGTTLFCQALIASLPVGYVNNWTSLFPRAPLLGQRGLQRPLRNDAVGFESFYGKTRYRYGPNDGLYLWDRWLGADRARIPDRVDATAEGGLREFFGAFEKFLDRPLVLKNNNLNVSADRVAEVLPEARFVCLRREPRFLGQSLLTARRTIHGDAGTPYGLQPDDRRDPDPIRDVALQVRFFQEAESQQRERLGERFQVVDYEAFCADPASAVGSVASLLAVPADPTRVQAAIHAGSVSRQRRLAEDEFARLERALEEVGALA